MIEKYITQIEVKDPRIKIHQLTYFDYEITEKRFPKISELNSIPKVLHIELEELIFKISQSFQGKRNLIEFGIDPKSTAEEALMNEIFFSKQKRIIKGIREISKEYINFRDIKWWNQIFGRWNPPVKYKNIIKDLSVASNLISRASRRGPANFIIISNSDVMILEDLNKFVYINNNAKPKHGETYILGNLMGMDLIVDPHAERGSLIVGRKAIESEGVIYIGSENKIQEIEGIENTDYIVHHMSKVTNVPNAGNNYIKIQLDCIKYPFLKHIWSQFKSIFKSIYTKLDLDKTK